MSLSGMKGSPWAGLSGAANGLASADVPATVLTWLPVLEMRTWAVACLPTGMFPNFTTGSLVASWLTAAVPVPVRVTVALSPLLPAMVHDPAAGLGATGAYETCTLMLRPGLILLPTAGRPAAGKVGRRLDARENTE